MSVIHRIKRWVLKQYIRRMPFPPFKDTGIIRQRITYSGKVQRVGFRDEMNFLAKRISITGNVRNVGEHTVVAELQGTPDRLEALKLAIQNEKRFIIERVHAEVLDCITNEPEFCIIG